MLEIDKDGNRFWYNEECQYHRIDGPAIEKVDGKREWLLNGKPHREDGPAVEYSDGKNVGIKKEIYIEKTDQLVNMVMEQNVGILTIRDIGKTDLLLNTLMVKKKIGYTAIEEDKKKGLVEYVRN